MNWGIEIEPAITRVKQQRDLLGIVLDELHENKNNPGRLRVDESALYLLFDSMGATITELDKLAEEGRRRNG